MIILGTNSIKDTGYNVANSCRFDGADSLQRSKGTQSSLQIGTYSFWIKRTNIDGTQHFVYSNSVDASNKGYYSLRADEKFRIVSDASSGELVLETSQLLRDPTAWMHIVIRIDTTQSTAANRCIFYINGVAVTALDTTTYPDQNANLKIFEGGETDKEFIGGMTGETSNLHCYLAEFVFCDGQSLAPTSFGEFDEDSPTIWKPKDVSGLTFGNQGWYLDFEDSSALGNSSNSNNFGTVNNLAATDQAVDTCSNNFMTLSPLTKTSATLSEGNLKQATAGNSSVATFGVSAGKWYFEQKLLGGNNEAHLGFALEGAGIFSDAVTGGTVRGAGYVSLYSFDGKIYNEGSATSSFGTFSANDIVGFALDVDNGNLYLYQNGSALNSGNAVVSGKTGKTWFPFGNFDAGDVTGIEHNFGGARTFTISSAVADGNGYGAFEYAPPSSYLALCTKNLGSDGG